MKALVLAGGLSQIELLNQLKARNITTVLADGNANALARPYADIFYQLPIFDIEAVKEVALKEKVDFYKKKWLSKKNHKSDTRPKHQRE